MPHSVPTLGTRTEQPFLVLLVDGNQSLYRSDHLWMRLSLIQDGPFNDLRKEKSHGVPLRNQTGQRSCSLETIIPQL